MERSLKLEESLKTKVSSLSSTIKKYRKQLKTAMYRNKSDTPPHPFWVIVRKEITDHVSSWRFIILLSLILLTCFGSLYTSITNLDRSVKVDDPAYEFFFLRLFTVSDGTL